MHPGSQKWLRTLVTTNKREANNTALGSQASELSVLGEEWSDTTSLERCLCDFLYPYVTPASVVAEIGVGGGRIAKKMFGKVKSLTCFDISLEMLKKAKVALEG